MVDRMIRAAMLNPAVYNEVERDVNATTEAFLVVLIVAVATGIGRLAAGVPGFIGGLVLAVLLWLLVAYITYLVGTSLFGGTATVGELLRTMGYAQTPRLLSVLGFIPVIGGIAILVGFILAVVAAVIAVREALDFDTGKAILTAIISWVVSTAIVGVVAWIVGTVFGLGNFLLTF